MISTALKMLKPRKSAAAPPNDTKMEHQRQFVTCALLCVFVCECLSPRREWKIDSVRIRILPNKPSPVKRMLRFKRVFGKIIVTKIDLVNLSKAWWGEKSIFGSFVIVVCKFNRCRPDSGRRWYSRLVCIPFWCKKSNRNWDSIRTCHRTN